MESEDGEDEDNEDEDDEEEEEGNGMIRGLLKIKMEKGEQLQMGSGKDGKVRDAILCPHSFT